MLFLQLVPVVLSLLVLAAHFLREGNLFLVIICVALAGLVAVPRRWAARTLQGALVLGAVEWLRTVVALHRIRVAEGLPATRMVIILVAVAAVTGLSALVFRARRARARFRLASPDSVE